MKIKSLNDEIDQLKTKSLSTNETEDDKEENIKKAQELQSKVLRNQPLMITFIEYVLG